MPRVMHIGLGEIGKSVINALLVQSKVAQLVAVVDTNPHYVGRNLRDILSRQDVPSLVVAGSIKDALANNEKPEVATVTTTSRIETIRPTLEQLIEARIHVVSSCEELALPTFRAPRVAAILDKAAAKNGVAILGTGVNPGFAMDAFALACTAPCTLVKHIRVVRSLDASKRRQQLQKKVGVGMEVKDVRAMIRKKSIGHVGLSESVAMIAAGLGWKLDAIKEQFHPVVADHLVSSEYFTVQPGQVRGMWMLAQGIVGRKKLIELDLMMAFDADTFDEVIVDGDPPILVRTKSGFPGEASTIAMIVNGVRTVPTLEPGLRTMMDVLRIRSIGA